MANLKKIATPKQKPKKPRGTSVAAIKLGGEPRLLMPDKIQLTTALNWYNRVADNPEQRVAWVLEFMKEQGSYKAEELSEFKRRGKKFLPTYSALARMISNGSTIEDKYTDLVNDKLSEFLTVKTEEELDDDGNVIVTATVKTVVKRDKTYGLVCSLVEYIDDQMDRVLAGEKIGSLYESLIGKGVNAQAAKDLKAFYKPQAFEFFELNKGNDEQLNEGYARFSKKVRKDMSAWMLQLVADLASLESTKKAVKRAPRKTRAPKKENLVKRMKHAKDSLEFKVKSIDPLTIIGAKTLWVFNTKTRQLGAYFAKDDSGLTVKGTTIENGSGEMKKLRNADVFLQGFLNGTAKAYDLKYKNVKAVPAAMNGRINNHIILLKVF